MTVSTTRVPGRPRFRLGPIVTLWRVQPLVVTAVMVLAGMVMLIFSVALGTEELNFRVVTAVLTGRGTTDQQNLVAGEALARAVAALFTGGALGLSGAIIQSLVRQPLAGPDVLGITSGGAAAAAVTATVTAGPAAAAFASGPVVVAAAVAGCMATGAAVMVLRERKHLCALRLAFVGMCIIFFTHALIRLVVAGDMPGGEETNSYFTGPAATWLFGSLAFTTWQSVIPVIITTVLVAPVIAAHSFKLKAITLGDATATGLGVPVRGTRVTLVFIALLLAAVAVAAAGPILFVAFAAPQLALRLANTATAPLVASAATGAALLLSADLSARLCGDIPVGVITAAIGGATFLVFLIRHNQRTMP